MMGLQDIFGNSYINDSTMTNTGSQQANSKNGNGVATNLTETNNGIARQSDLVDEVIALKQQQQYPESHLRSFFSSIATTNQQESSTTSTDEIINDLTRNVNNLTMMERQKAQNEVYGFMEKNRTEDPVELSLWMNDMDDVIQRVISGNDKKFSALRLAMHTPAENSTNVNLGVSTMSGFEYVQSQKLKFLRASDWNVENAVVRMALFFELKLEYFGTKPLIRDLTMKDLTKEDIDMWKRYGFLQLAQDQDTNGRAIMVFITRQQTHLPVATVVRIYYELNSIVVPFCFV